MDKLSPAMGAHPIERESPTQGLHQPNGHHVYDSLPSSSALSPNRVPTSYATRSDDHTCRMTSPGGPLSSTVRLQSVLGGVVPARRVADENRCSSNGGSVGGLADRSSSTTCAPPGPERAAGDVCDRWREVGRLGESEVFRGAVERGRDIIDDAADAGVFAVLHG
jgi:hypothetical protein